MLTGKAYDGPVARVPGSPRGRSAIGLYRKFGFVEEGRRIKHYRRASGELWDVMEMGLLL